jgi:hypothetical protein
VAAAAAELAVVLVGRALPTVVALSLAVAEVVVLEAVALLEVTAPVIALHQVVAAAAGLVVVAELMATRAAVVYPFLMVVQVAVAVAEYSPVLAEQPDSKLVTTWQPAEQVVQQMALAVNIPAPVN